LDCFQLILMGFLTFSLHKNSQYDVKLLKTWWFWHILGKGIIFTQIRNTLIFVKKSPWTPKSQLSPVWIGIPKRLTKSTWTPLAKKKNP
jgi:hypothetical protein